MKCFKKNLHVQKDSLNTINCPNNFFVTLIDTRFLEILKAFFFNAFNLIIYHQTCCFNTIV